MKLHCCVCKPCATARQGGSAVWGYTAQHAQQHYCSNVQAPSHEEHQPIRQASSETRTCPGRGPHPCTTSPQQTQTMQRACHYQSKTCWHNTTPLGAAAQTEEHTHTPTHYVATCLCPVVSAEGQRKLHCQCIPQLIQERTSCIANTWCAQVMPSLACLV